MSNFIIKDFKNAWNKKDNGLIKIILINIIIFIGISIMKVFFQIGGLENLYIKFLNSIMLPADLKHFIFQPWSIITYFFLHTNFSHILWNMLFLYWFGKIIQDNIGNNALISLYVLGGIIGGLLYIAIYNIIPYYGDQVNQSLMLGASAGVFSVVLGSATLIPNYTFHLLFIGAVRIKYIALFYVALSFFDVTGNNSGGEIAHLGGAFIGYLYIRQLQNGSNMGDPIIKVINFFNKTDFKKTTNKNNKQNNNEEISQDDIDKILDKISDSGYSSLNKSEKEKLFNASKK